MRAVLFILKLGLKILAAPGLPLFFFARIVALLQTTSDNIIRNGGEG